MKQLLLKSYQESLKASWRDTSSTLQVNWNTKSLLEQVTVDVPFLKDEAEYAQ